MTVSNKECARLVLQVIPMIMQMIRSEMRSHRIPGLSIPQFRTLVFLNRHAGASLSELADHLELTLPSTSKLVDGLVSRDLVAREAGKADRRRVTLKLTKHGHAAFQAARVATEAHLQNLLSHLSLRENTKVAEAMEILSILLAPTLAKKNS
jgi:DNA-binding MarR family transcriptional regulator